MPQATLRTTRHDGGDSRHGMPVPLSLTALGGLLFSTGWYTRQRTKRIERRHSPAGRFVPVDGARLHILDEGPRQGRAIVFLHGIATMGIDFTLTGTPGRLAEGGYRCLSVDRPGYGHSTRARGIIWTAWRQGQAVWQALDRLGIDHPILVGHSFGTQVALSMAAQRPGHVAGQVLISGYYFPTPRIEPYTLGLGAVPVLGDLLAHTIDPLLMRASLPLQIKAIFSPRPVPTVHRRYWPMDLAERPSQIRAFAEDWAVLIAGASTLVPLYRQITTPTILLHGTADRVSDAETQSARLSRRLPNADLELLPGEGHMPHYGRKDRVMRAITRILRVSDGARPPDQMPPSRMPLAAGAASRAAAPTV
jgi:pimeloyl-ACP methyl ester carboxylesterase